MLAVGTVALHGGGPADGEPKELVCWEEILRRVGKRPIAVVQILNAYVRSATTANYSARQYFCTKSPRTTRAERP